MRRYYNNGTSFVEALTKGTPIGAVGSIVKKIKKSKEDKESRNPDPKTPKMMGKAGADLTKKEKVIIAKNLSELRSGELKDEKRINKNYKKKFEKPLGKMKPEVQPARNLKD
jgi:hypothetical protein